jgi:hypothetical protein
MSTSALILRAQTRLFASVVLWVNALMARYHHARLSPVRANHVPVVLIIIPIAVVIALGLLTAWFIYCQRRGLWPALDMPSWSSGGTWKVYCAR